MNSKMNRDMLEDMGMGHEDADGFFMYVAKEPVAPKSERLNDLLNRANLIAKQIKNEEEILKSNWRCARDNAFANWKLENGFIKPKS